MKSIFTPPEIQFSGTNARIKWINDKMRLFLRWPILILFFLWGFYALFDGGTTYFFELPSQGVEFATITAVIGFLSSCIYFFWVFPSLTYSKNPFFILGISCIGIFCLSVLKYFLLQLVGVNLHPPLIFAAYELMRQWVFLVVTFTVWGFYALIRALQEKHKTEIRFDKLKIVHNNAQLSPHFTLNLIGDISAKSLRYSPELFLDLNHFITILRYAYLDNDKFNSLASEIDALYSYLHGQKIRFGETFFLKDKIDPDLLNFDELYMPKLLLITLIENVFKHGIFQDSKKPVSIEAKMLYEEENSPVFFFSTQNKISEGLPLEKTGFGIETVRNLLDYFFQNALLTTSSNGTIFSLNLTIPYARPNQTWPDR
ncbi:MAG TPA: histidine kinase [Algoriphagus sp.]|nr:histidine kinase [Algoriphagus sp.]